MASTGNSTSTTGPMTRATRPVAVAVSTVAVIVSHLPAFASARALAPPTISLISWVISACRAELASRVSDLMRSRRVVGRALHRAPAGGVLRGGRLQQRVVDPALDVPRQQRVEHSLRRRLEVVERERAAAPWRSSCVSCQLQRQQPDVHRVLGEHRDELGGDEVELVDPAVRRSRVAKASISSAETVLASW